MSRQVLSGAGRTAMRMALVAALACSTLAAPPPCAAQPAPRDAAALPVLTAPVNDFAGVVDESSKAALTQIITALQRKTGDAVVVATVQSIAPYADIREYAVELFENRGRGIGARDKETGALVLLSVGDRRVWIEVGYGLEGFITDGFAGETSREYMAPLFRQGRYGEGLRAGVTRLVARIAQERGISIDDLPATPAVAPRGSRPGKIPVPLLIIVAIILLQILRSRRGPRGRPPWTGGPWSGWSGGVGPFGGTFGGWTSGHGGFGSGGFGGGGGGGFGGFGGGRSGGGGGGAGW
jgi:uncharacterized protein